MSSAHLLCLLVVLGVGADRHESSDMIPGMMRRYHRIISKALNLTRGEISGRHLFKCIKDNSTCQINVQTMNATLGAYIRILLILQKDQPNLHNETIYLQDMTKMLQSHLSHTGSEKEVNYSCRNEIKVEDVNHRPRALAQFLGVYQQAAILQRHCRQKAH